MTDPHIILSLTTEQGAGDFFIPPYEKLNASNAFNTNLNKSAYTSSLGDIDISGTGELGSILSLEYIFKQGPGDHGWGTSGGTTDIPFPGNPVHGETTGVPYHHSVSSDYDPYYPGGSGSLSDYHAGRGIPWHSDQGVQQLWTTFFGYYYPLSELEWNTESEYYHYLFGTYYARFINTFLSNFSAIRELYNDFSTYVDEVNSTPSSAMSEYYNILTTLESETAENTDGSTSSIKSYLGPTTLEAELPYLLEAFSTHYDSFSNLFTYLDTAGKTTNDEIIDWLLADDGSSWWQYDLANDSGEAVQGLNLAWQLFLFSSDVEHRIEAAVLWSFTKFLDLLILVTNVSIAQTQRLQNYNYAQEEAADAILALSTFPVATSSNYTNIELNEYASAYMNFYNTARQSVQKVAQEQSTLISNSSNAVTQEVSTINSVIQQLTSLLTTIFGR